MNKKEKEIILKFLNKHYQNKNRPLMARILIEELMETCKAEADSLYEEEEENEKVSEIIPCTKEAITSIQEQPEYIP